MAGWAGLSGKVYALIAGTAVAAGGGASLIIKNDQGQPVIQSLLGSTTPEQVEEMPPETKEEAGEQVASLPPKTEEQPLEPETTGPKLPGFDILRVEKDGSVVIAGNGPANSEIEILAGDDILATGKSGPDGDFAIVFDDPLKPGSHELFIRARPENAEPVMSAEAGIVTIPEPDDASGEVLAMVQEAGEATRLIQAPEPETAPEPVEQVVETEAVEPEKVGEAEAPVAEEAETVETAATEEPEPVAEEPRPEQKPIARTIVQAVDVEPDRLFVAGRGEANARARIYINGEFKGQTRIGPEGAFLFDLGEKLEPGKYDFRVDVLGSSPTEVASRASVIVDHAPEPVEVAEAPSEPEEQGVAESEQSESVTREPAAEAVEVVTVEEVPSQVAETEAPVEAEAPAAPEEQETEPAQPVIKTGRSVIIRRGDNLWRISRRMLGEGRKYTLIFSANANQIEDPDRIYPGQVFDVPDAEEESADATGSQNG